MAASEREKEEQYLLRVADPALASVAHHLEGLARGQSQEQPREVAGVGDRRAGHHEQRVGAMRAGAQAAQAAQHQGGVAAEGAVVRRYQRLTQRPGERRDLARFGPKWL